MKGGAVGHTIERDHPKTIPAQFALIWFSGFRGEDLNVIVYQNMPNFYNRLKKIISSLSVVIFCFTTNQNELKFYLQLHGNE
jgi:amino acid permease